MEIILISDGIFTRGSWLYCWIKTTKYRNGRRFEWYNYIKVQRPSKTVRNLAIYRRFSPKGQCCLSICIEIVPCFHPAGYNPSARDIHWLCETNQIHVHNSPLGRDINECHFYGECHTHWTPICWLYPLYPLFLVAIFKIPPIIIFNIAKVLLTWCHAIILNQSIKELWEIAFFLIKFV